MQPPLNLQIDQLFPRAVPSPPQPTNRSATPSCRAASSPPSTYKSNSYSQLPCSLPLNLQIDQLLSPAVPPPSTYKWISSSHLLCLPPTYKSISYSQLSCSLPLNVQIDQLFPPAVPPPLSTSKSISYSPNLQIDQLLPAAVQPPPQRTNRSAFPTCCAPPPLNLQIDQLLPPAVPPLSTYKSISYSQLPCSLPSTYK